MREYAPISDEQVREIMKCGDVSSARIKIARLVNNASTRLTLKIKDLDWIKDGRGWWVSGPYRIEEDDLGGYAARVVGPGSKVFNTLSSEKTLREAQQIAQGHHEDFILSRLEAPHPFRRRKEEARQTEKYEYGCGPADMSDEDIRNSLRNLREGGK